MALMSWTCPGFRHLFYKLLSNNNGEYGAVPTTRVPIAATDARNILINPDEFFKFPLKQRVFIMGHEILHNVFGDVELLHRCVQSETVPMHDGSTVPFRNEIMQKAMDYRINALLVDSKIGEMPTQNYKSGGAQAGCYDPAISGPNDSVLDVYKKIYEDDDGNGGGPGGFDVVLQPGASTGQSPAAASNQRNAQQWAIEISAANNLESMNAQGKMPACLKRMFEELLTPKVLWTDHIRAIMARRVGSGSYDWRRPDRRFLMQDLHLPSRSGHGAGWLVIWGDTSGSIGRKDLDKYLAELGGIIEDVRPRRITVLWCDAQIHQVDEVQEAIDLQQIRYRGVEGGGGTAVTPCFDWIADNTEVPDMFIGFTDGYVSFPQHAPTYPVIWASISKAEYPWGEVVRIDE